MTTKERRTQIVKLINDSNNRFKSSDLAELLNVTTETIRKDLIYLDSRKLIKKFHGGAMPVTEFTEWSFQMRQGENIAAKQAIALKALEQFPPSGVIFLDAGSTTCELAKLLVNTELSEKSSLYAIVTNSFSIVNELTGSSFTKFFLGGDISDVTRSTSGLWAVNALNSIKIDVAFMGSSGFFSHHGPGTKLSNDALLKSEVVKNAAKKIILADHTKFASNALMQFAEWGDIDLLITDSHIDTSQIKALEKNVEIMIAPADLC